MKQYPEITLQELIDILSVTIKRDDENKLITLICMLSAYTPSDQLNITFNAPSSSGKSFIPLQVSTLFPDEDLMKLSYASPTSFFHSAWEYNKETQEYVVNLEHKILIFLDQPHSMVLERLRPLLSHDEKEIRAQITDKTSKDGTRAKKIVLIGFPAVVFCSSNLHMDEQEMTRFILLSPELNQDKIKEGILSSIEKSADLEAYQDKSDLNPARQRLKGRICAIKNSNVDAIKLHGVERDYLIIRFLDRDVLKPRHLRDIQHLASVIKVLALLNLWTREQFGDTIYANREDIDNAFRIWDKIAYAQELSISPYVYRIFKEVITTAYNEKNKVAKTPLGVSQKDILKQHNKVHGRTLNPLALRQQILPMLLQAGLITEDQDLNDKRIKLITPQLQNYSEQSGVPTSNDTSEKILEAINEVFGEGAEVLT